MRNRKALALAGAAGVAAILVALSSPAEAARKRKGSGGGYNPPYAAMVVDVKTGRVLHAENEDALRFPASITKVMTLYLLFEQLERGKLSLDTPLRVSANAARQAPSKIGFDPGETIAVEDAIKALVTKSANDVAVTVAENLAGSEDEFAEEMTRRARSLGMSRTVFRNASGLPDSEQVTTARDLTILARAIQERFPRYYRFFQTRVFNYAGASHRNHNKLLGRVEGVDGIKTGFTNASGFNLMTNARTEDRHIVAVVLGGRSGASRDQTMAALVRQTLPRAFAGARQTPSAVAEAPAAPLPIARPAPVAVADASPQAPLQLQPQVQVQQSQSQAQQLQSQVAAAPVPAPVTTAALQAGNASQGATPTAVAAPETATTPSAAARKPLDLNSLRPVVASAAGASTTTTPSSLPPMRWQAGPQPAAQPAQAYAALQHAEPARQAPLPSAAPVPAARPDERATGGQTAVAKSEPAAEKREAPRAAASGWVIQLGATDDESKAKTMLDNARSRSGRALAQASPFTEKVTKGEATLYRARFSGFSEADEAEAACKVLKRNGFACFALRS
ncbi:MAG TPA: serine hydrolase [Microvirga sp.]|nr:serine hydrolase [Microvirga sp.]